MNKKIINFLMLSIYPKKKCSLEKITLTLNVLECNKWPYIFCYSFDIWVGIFPPVLVGFAVLLDSFFFLSSSQFFGLFGLLRVARYLISNRWIFPVFHLTFSHLFECFSCLSGEASSEPEVLCYISTLSILSIYCDVNCHI